MRTKTSQRKSRTQNVSKPSRAAVTTIDLVPALLSIKSILVPLDFSAESKKALAYAVAFARQFGGKLTLVHVVEPMPVSDFASSFPLALETKAVLAGAKRELDKVIGEMGIDPALIAKVLTVESRAYHGIVETARRIKAGLIVIATHGYTGLKHALLGSTAERVVRHAPCPVLVVRNREKEFVSK